MTVCYLLGATYEITGISVIDLNYMFSIWTKNLAAVNALSDSCQMSVNIYCS